MAPLLSTAELGPVETVATLIRLLIHERFVPIIKRGSAAAALPVAYAKLMKQMSESFPNELNELIVDSLTEIGEIAEYFLVVSDPAAFEEIAVDI